jgi:hypothetical protein
MRTWTALIVVFATGCLSEIIPSHQPPAGPDPTPMQMDPAPTDDGGTPDPAPAPTSGVDGGTSMLAPMLQLDSSTATLTAPMAQASDANAIGGTYIMVPAGGLNGKAVFTFAAPAEGDYVFWGRVLAPADANNSFHWSIDADTIDNDPTDGTSTIWDLPITTVFAWSKVNYRNATGNTDITTHLTAGSHTIYLNEREDQSGLDQLVITTDATYVPN